MEISGQTVSEAGNVTFSRSADLRSAAMVVAAMATVAAGIAMRARGAIARHADIGRSRCAARGPHLVGEQRGILRERFDRPKAGDVDGEKEIGAAIGLAQVAVERLHGIADRAGGQPACQEIDHRREAKTLGTGGRQQDALDRLRRIHGRNALAGGGPAGRNVLTLAFGKADLSHRARAERQVEHDRITGARHRDRDRIIAHHALGTARRRQ